MYYSRFPNSQGTYGSMTFIVAGDSYDCGEQTKTLSLQTEGALETTEIPFSSVMSASFSEPQQVLQIGIACDGNLMENLEYTGDTLFNIDLPENIPAPSFVNQNLIIDNLYIYGLALLAILGVITTLMLGLLVYKYGKRLLFDESITLGGYYLRKTPYAGYNRWRSQKWNSNNTM